MDSDIDTFTDIRVSLARLRTPPDSLGVFGADKHRFHLNPPLTQAEVDALEAQYQILLPLDYRTFLMQVGNGGAGPYYGLFRWGEVDRGFDYAPWQDVPGIIGDLAVPFPHTSAWNDLTGYPEAPDDAGDFDEDEYYDKWDAWRKKYLSPHQVNGAVPISHRGCALYDWLILTGPEAGNVWRDDRADDDGLYPLLNTDGGRVGFLNWYRGWLDDTLNTLETGTKGTWNLLVSSPPAPPLC